MVGAIAFVFLKIDSVESENNVGRREKEGGGGGRGEKGKWVRKNEGKEGRREGGKTEKEKWMILLTILVRFF